MRETLKGNRGSEGSDETPVIEIGVKILSGKSGPGNLVINRGRAGGGVIRNMILRKKGSDSELLGKGQLHRTDRRRIRI